ncbi:hypothetical protein QUB68_26990 [Microcoleus sp. A006_D1]|uniref:hypothetical protein n=1 Tax=Microcoleus sp. A006_D1 TaxID=3055267 RepID=UPI002FD0734D
MKRELSPTALLSAVWWWYLGLLQGTAGVFGVVASRARRSRYNFTKLLQFAVTPGPPIALVLPCHLCHFFDRHQRQQHLLTYPLS